MGILRLGWPTLVVLVCCVAAAVAVSSASDDQPLSEPIEQDPAALAIPGALGDAPPLEAVVAEIMRLREQQGDDKLLENDIFHPLPLDTKIADRPLQLSTTPQAQLIATDSAVELQAADQIQALRDSASNLDEVANLLERHEQYPRADEARKLATSLRLDARKLREQDATDLPTAKTADAKPAEVLK